MTALLYAIAEDHEPQATAPGLRFLGDGPVGICKTIEQHPGSSPEALRAHMQTVSELMRDRAVLPARYGTVLEESEIERLIEQRREELLSALERVRGSVEVAVHTRPAAALTSEAAPPRSGTEYLQRRLEAERELEALRATLAPLQGIARGAKGPNSRGACAYLVQSARLAEFLTAVRGLDCAHPELELVCTGPWPPFSFAEGLL